jgi:hypothetical protein
MASGDNGEDDLPPPEIVKIRNLVGDSAWQSLSQRGALLKLAGSGVHGNSVDVSILAPVLEHFDRLVRITQAHRSGLEVKRRGPITEVKGAGRLAAMAPAPGSYAIPMRLDPPRGEMFSADHSELEDVVSLITADDATLDKMLTTLPERVGDELVNLLRATDAGKVDLGVVVLRDGGISAQVEVAAQAAGQRVQILERPQSSDAGHQVLRGTMWRIDTKHRKVTIDAASPSDEAAIVAVVAFKDDQLEELRKSLREYVEVEVSIIEQRRSYEQTARSQEMKLLSIKPWNPVKDAYAAEAPAAEAPAAEAVAEPEEAEPA